MGRRTPLAEAEIASALGGLEGWTRRGDELVLTYEAADFPAAIRLVDAVAVIAEAADHHPDIDIRRRTVTFALCTHSSGRRITALDVSMAAQISGTIAEGSKHSTDCSTD